MMRVKIPQGMLTADQLAAHKLMRRLAANGFELHERHLGTLDELEAKVAA